MTRNFTIGEKHKETFLITKEVINDFAQFSADYNPIHMDIEYAKEHGYPRQVSHGVIQVAYLSKIIGMDFPGSGAMWMRQSVNWLLPVFVGDTITICLTIKHFSIGTKTVTLIVEITNGNNKIVMEGESQVKVTDKLSFNSDSTAHNITLSSKSIKSRKITNNQRVALVTGSSRGIGAAIAKQLASDGYKVVINYNRNAAAAKNVADEISILGGDAMVVRADVTNDYQVNEMLERVYEEWGRCDALIHGATPPIKSVRALDLEYEDIALYFNYYIKGAVSLVNNITPLMIDKNFGRFVFMGTSYLFSEPPAGMMAYVTAKEALWGYTKSLSAEIARHGITSNMVSPSLTITDLTEEIPVRVKEIQAMKNPMRRLVTVVDIAHQVSYLCSESSGFINGVYIPINGGPI